MLQGMEHWTGINSAKTPSVLPDEAKFPLPVQLIMAERKKVSFHNVHRVNKHV
jgi:hypothetical protein